MKGEEGRDKAKEVAAQELRITEDSLKENPKSYYAWFHRLWILQKRLLPLDNELNNINRSASKWHLVHSLQYLQPFPLPAEVAIFVSLS